MLIALICDVVLAAFAVIGFCCLIHAVLDGRACSGRLGITVTVRDEKDADMLDMLLHEADSAFFRIRGMKTVVLVSASLFEREKIGSTDGVLHDRYAELLEAYAAECYIMDWD